MMHILDLEINKTPSYSASHKVPTYVHCPNILQNLLEIMI